MAAAVLRVSAWFLALANFWIFSRFTVDDAFITWRYGKNLAQFGVWNYNPTNFDPTQAYTNPIYAFLSVIPAFLGINVVLFFKLFSLLMVIGLAMFMIRKRPASELALITFFAVPATVIHLFSGLETFLFVILMFLVLVAVSEHRVTLALVATSLLFLTRPEAWLLGLLVPLALSFTRPKTVQAQKVYWTPTKRLIAQFAILGTVLVAYLGTHYWMFHEILPNAFFVKSGRSVNWYYLTNLPFVLLPLIALWLVGLRRIVLLLLSFGVPLIVNYATSSMGMDYASRYAFHIYGPIALFSIYIFSSKKYRDILTKKFEGFGAKWSVRLVATLTLIIAVGFIVPTASQNQLALANYYPRALQAQGRIGELAKVSSSGMAISDAGLAAYVAEIPNLDTYSLGTRLGTKNGITKKLFDQYRVDFVALRGHKKQLATLLPIIAESGLTHVCDVYYAPKYQFQLWMKQATDAGQKVCRESIRDNNIDELTFFSTNVTKAPWVFWH